MAYRKHSPVKTKNVGISRTVQADSPGTDVSSIMARFQQTGLLPDATGRTPLYGDFSEARDLHHHLTEATRAQEDFMALPSIVRAAASNDPVELLNMLNTPEGCDQLRAAGLDIPERDPSKESDTTTPPPSKAPLAAPPAESDSDD